jgi:type I restriction enzyme S subunit
VPEGDGIPVLRANNIQSGQLVSEGLVFVSKEIPRKLILREGDIVICSRNGSRNLIGKNARVSGEFMGITFGAFNTVYRSRYSDFIYWVLQSPIFSYQAGAYLTSTINQLTVATLGNLVVPLPPPDEQKAICTHIERRMPAFNRLLDQVRTSIDRLKEYRSSLITAAVTGQIDVMAWSKRGHADRQFDAIQQEATS